MTICNPCTFFVNGNDQESFTYEGGKILYHFSPVRNNFQKHYGMNLVFFANDEKHAIDVIKRMLSF